MSGLHHELRLVLRAPVSALALGLLLLLASLAVLSGSWEVARQRETLARLAVLQQDELAALAAKPQTARQAGAGLLHLPRHLESAGAGRLHGARPDGQRA